MNSLIIILIIIFISTLIRSAFGFGDAIIAMPLLVLFIDIKIVTPLIALIAFFISISILIKNWKQIEFKSAWRLIIASLAGIPIGLWYLKDANENIIKLVLGAMILIFAVFKLVQPKIIVLKSDILAWLFGFIAGVLGGAYNTNGPPIVIYSTLKQWNPQNFRATLQGYFFTTGILVVAGHAFAGNFSSYVLIHFLYCLPVVLFSVIIGARLNRRMSFVRFHKYIYLLLILLSLNLIFNSIGHQ